MPVTTVAINKAKNAALLTLTILGIKYPEIRQKLKEYRERTKQKVEKKTNKPEALGYGAYLGEIGARKN